MTATTACASMPAPRAQEEADHHVAALAEAVVARQRAEERLARVEAQMEAFAGTGPIRHVRLCDLHARFHGRTGDLLAADECEVQDCTFWPAAAFVMDSLPSFN